MPPFGHVLLLFDWLLLITAQVLMDQMDVEM